LVMTTRRRRTAYNEDGTITEDYTKPTDG